jgi:hypothetical protein
MTTPVVKAKPASLETELAVLNTKLDGIQTTLNVRLTNIDKGITDNAAEIKSVERHANAGIKAQGEAMAELLKGKTDKSQSDERYGVVNDRIGKIENHMKWVVYLIVGAVLTAIVAMVVIKPDRPVNPQAQLTVPAVIQQHVPARVQNHPPEASK